MLNLPLCVKEKVSPRFSVCSFSARMDPWWLDLPAATRAAQALGGARAQACGGAHGPTCLDWID